MPKYQQRKYSNPTSIGEDVATILSEIATEGVSGGWCGSMESFNAMKDTLQQFNVYYACDFHGEWKLKREMPLPKKGELLKAINPCKMEATGNQSLTVGKKYSVWLSNDREIAVIDDANDEHYFPKDEWMEFFERDVSQSREAVERMKREFNNECERAGVDADTERRRMNAERGE